MPDTNQSQTSQYSKKSPVKLVLTYLLVGLLVYGLIYYLAFYKKGASNKYEVMEEDQSEEVVQLPEEGAVVTLSSSGFSPKEVTIKAGTMVKWVNDSGSTATVNSAPHPDHTDYTALNLGEFDDGNSMSLVFDTPGTYKYHNHLNSSQFGTVVVE